MKPVSFREFSQIEGTTDDQCEWWNESGGKAACIKARKDVAAAAAAKDAAAGKGKKPAAGGTGARKAPAATVGKGGASAAAAAAAEACVSPFSSLLSCPHSLQSEQRADPLALSSRRLQPPLDRLLFLHLARRTRQARIALDLYHLLDLRCSGDDAPGQDRPAAVRLPAERRDGRPERQGQAGGRRRSRRRRDQGHAGHEAQVRVLVFVGRAERGAKLEEGWAGGGAACSMSLCCAALLLCFP